MQHASESTLHELAPLLERLRSLDGLVEKRPGVFYRRSKAFLHFHEDPSGLFVDVRFRVDEPFTRLPVSTDAQRSALVKMINQALPPDGQSPTRSRTTQSKRST
jgi:hypothetical protein